MKKRIVLQILPLVITAFVAFMTACDATGDGESCVAGTWRVATPASGATNVDCHSTFVINYCGSLDTTVNAEQIFIPDPDSASFDMTFNDANSTITISGGTATIVMDAGRSLSSETAYSTITISGFKDSDGIDISSATLLDYHFTTEPK
jgi:hypothetical protein